MRARVVLMLACAACVTPEQIVDPPAPFEARLGATDVWSGGEVLVFSQFFRLVGMEPVAWIDADTLSQRRVDDSTFAVTLPDGNGTRVLHTALPTSGHGPRADTLRLYGFRESVSGPQLTGALYVRPASPIIFGTGEPGLIEYNLRTGGVERAWPATVHSTDCTQGVGPSIYPRNIVLRGKNASGACDSVAVWRDDVSLTRLTATPVGYPWAMFAELGPGLLKGDDDAVELACPGPCFRRYGSGGYAVTIGHAARRVIPHGYRNPVIDGLTGDSLYPAASPGFNPRISGAAFSANQDTLYIAGVDERYGTSFFRIMSSADGTLLGETQGVDAAVGVARNPSRPLLYVAALQLLTAYPNLDTMLPVLRVLDARTLAPVATLRAPRSVAFHWLDYLQFRVVPDPAAASIYVIGTYQILGDHTNHALVLRYDHLP